MRTKIYFLRGENHFVVYVGKTGGTLEKRLWGHLNEAQNGHKCKRCNGIRKMLREGKVPTITLQTEVEGNGNNAERAYIKWLRSKGVPLWNITDGGEGWTVGMRHSKESIKKCKESYRYHAPALGTHQTIETKKKVESNPNALRTRFQKGHIPWIKGKKGMTPGFRGKHHTEASNQKNREAHLGKIPWNKGQKMKEEQRQKLLGHFVSEETRQKIRDTKKLKRLLKK